MSTVGQPPNQGPEAIPQPGSTAKIPSRSPPPLGQTAAPDLFFSD